MANTKQRSIVRLAPHPDLIDTLIKQIVMRGGLKIIGLGVFKLQRMKAIKNGFNPYTVKKQSFPAYTKITFTPSKALKDKIQKWK